MSAPRRKSALETMELKPFKCTVAFLDHYSFMSVSRTIVSNNFKAAARYYFREQLHFRQFHGQISQLFGSVPCADQDKINFIRDQFDKESVLFKKGYFAPRLLTFAIDLDLDLAGKIVARCADDKETLGTGFHHFLNSMPHINTVTDARKRLMTTFRYNMSLSTQQRVINGVVSGKRSQAAKDREIGCLYFQPPTREAKQDKTFRQQQYWFVAPSKATSFGLPPRVENFLVTFLPYQNVACGLALVNKHFRAASEYYFQRFDFDLALSSRELYIELKRYQQLSLGESIQNIHMSDMPKFFGSKDSTATCDELIKQRDKAINSKLYGSMNTSARIRFLYYKKLPVAIKRDFFQPSFFYPAINLDPKRTMKVIERGEPNGPTLQRVFQYFLGGSERMLQFRKMMSQFRKMIPKADFNHIIIDLLVEHGRNSVVRFLMDDWQSLLGEKNLNGKYALQLAIEDPRISKETRNWLLKESPKAVQKLQNSWLKENAPAPTSRRFG